MRKMIKPHRVRKIPPSTGLAQYKGGKDQILKSPARLQRRKKRVDEFDNGKNMQSLIYYDSSTGKFTNANDEEVTPLNRIGDDPSQWTYVDSQNRRYTPTQTQVDSGEITQGEAPSIMDNFLSWSNRHYRNPILGAPARYADMVRNGQDPITGVASFVPGVGEVIDLGSATADALSGNYGQAVVGGTASLLPFLPYNKARQLYNKLKNGTLNRILRKTAKNSNEVIINDIPNISEPIVNKVQDPVINEVQKPVINNRTRYKLNKVSNNTNYGNLESNYVNLVQEALNNNRRNPDYDAYLDSYEIIDDRLNELSAQDSGIFGPDFQGYRNDLQNEINRFRSINQRYNNIRSNPNSTIEDVNNLERDYSEVGFNMYVPYQLRGNSELETLYNTSRAERNNLPNYMDFFRLKNDIHDRESLQHMRENLRYYDNVINNNNDITVNNYRQIYDNAPFENYIFMRNGETPEYIQLRNELERRRDAIRDIAWSRMGSSNSTIRPQDKPVVNLISNTAYDPNNLPENFINSNSGVSDIHSTAYFGMSPREAVARSEEDFNRLKHGQAWNLTRDGATSTDSYPLMLNMMKKHKSDGLIKPIKDDAGNVEMMRLNNLGNIDGEQAINRINKKIQQIQDVLGEELPKATFGRYGIMVPKILFRKYNNGKDNSIIKNTIAYNQWRQSLPSNLQTETTDYDLYGAFKAGLQPEWNDKDKSYHLGSRDPKTGRILKKPGHPTFGQAIYNDMLLGYYPIYKDGEIYTENPFEYNSGKDSGIHIKKKNRGKFTAAAKRAGMGVQAYARKILSAPKGKYSPTLRRRAAFAKAASKFKH